MQPLTASEREAILARFLDDKAAQKPTIQTRYLQYYENVLEDVGTGSFGVAVGMPVHSDHAEMRSLFDELVSKPTQTKKKLKDILAATSSGLEKDIAIRAMLRVALMVDCGSKEDYPEGYKVRDFVPCSWSDDQSFCTYAQAVFPPPKLSPVTRERVYQVISQRSRLKAWKLESRYKVHLRPTNDLAEHLVFDGRILKVFGQVSFLKAHLRRTRLEPIDLSFEKSLEKGTLPPQLLLEVVDSIQFLLFPNDKKSVKSLDGFIKTHGFDPDAKYREGRIREFPADFEYKYFGNRVAALLDIVNKPPPANRVVAWFERHTSERNALTVAILGLFLTALFGFLTTVTGFVAMVYSIKQYNVALKALPSGPK